MSAMKAFRIRRPLTLAACALANTATGTALATGLSWSNAAGGSASAAGNWSPAQIPTANDDLTFNLNNTFPVTFNSTVAGSRTQLYKRGVVTLSMSNPHAVGLGMTIGDVSGDNATASLTTGTLTSNAAVIIGNASGSTGVLNVNDDDADFILANSADLTIGNNGTGTLSITGGGNLVVADQLIGGSNATSISNITVSGFVAQAPFPISRLEVQGTNQSRIGQGGDATVNISNGARAQFAGDLVFGNGSASTTTVTVQGSGLVVGATLDVAGDLLLGRNTSAAAPAGVTTLNVNADGRVVVGDTLFVAGDPDGGTATLHLADEGLITTGSLTIGFGSTLDLDGGAINVDGGVLTNASGDPLDINGGTANPVLTLINGATAALIPEFGIALRVGGGSGANFADFDVRSGSDLTINSGQVQLGVSADDTGGMIVNGVGSNMTLGAGSTLVVGQGGSGRFETELGGATSGDVLMIARLAGSDGLALFENPTTTAQFEQIYVGGSNSAAGGAGTLVVNQDATLSVPNGGTPVHIWPTGLLNITSGQMNVAGNVNCDGELQLAGTGTLNAIQVNLHGDLIAHPNIAGGPAFVTADLQASGTATIRAIHGDVMLGNAGSVGGFSADVGTLIETGANTMTLFDADEAEVDTVVIAGGTLAAPNGIEILNNGSIDGNGTITTSELFFNSGGGVITATGASGITINGTLRNNSGTVDGTKFTFNGPDGGWTGAGAINARAVFNSGAEVNALANMTIGLNVFDGVTFNAGSELHADTRTVTLIDSNGIGLPSVTDFSGGHVVCSQNLVVNNGRRLSGRGGSIDCPTLTVNGRLSPGELVGEPVGETGEMTINANLVLQVNADTDIEIQGLLGPAEYDRVVVNGVATLDGDLNITFINGFSPPLGSVWTIMEYDSKVGAFANINITAGPTCVFVAVSDTAIVVSRGLPGDLDHDGDVDISDLAFLLSNFGCQGGVEFPCPVDFDFNGDTDITDLAILLSNFGQTCN